MPSEFQYDVCLSHSAKDKAVVRPLAERLRAAVRHHLKVGFDEWVLNPGDENQESGSSRRESAQTFERPKRRMSGLMSAATREEMIEARLERSRVLPLVHRMGEGGRRPGEGCMSAQAFGSDWARLLPASQPSAINHQPACAPLNHERRFIPLRLDDAPINCLLSHVKVGSADLHTAKSIAACVTSN